MIGKKCQDEKNEQKLFDVAGAYGGNRCKWGVGRQHCRSLMKAGVKVVLGSEPE